MRERWKRAFELDPELPLREDRVELTSHQKGWLVRAWTNFFGYIPNAIPIYNEQEGFAHRIGIEVQWHHIEPIGEVVRIYGQSSDYYNNPRNLVPVCKVNHVGNKAGDDDFVIHPDTMQATRSYGLFKEGKIDDPYKTMIANRHALTDAGLKYHEDDYDQYLLQLADMVISTYQRDFPEDQY